LRLLKSGDHLCRRTVTTRKLKEPDAVEGSDLDGASLPVEDRGLGDAEGDSEPLTVEPKEFTEALDGPAEPGARTHAHSISQSLTEIQAPFLRAWDAYAHVVEVPQEIVRAGEILKSLRERLELSQDDFAPVLGLTQSHLAKVEKGRFALKPKHIEQLARKHPVEAQRIRELIARAKGWAVEDPAAATKTKVMRSKTRDEGFAPLVGRVSCGTFDEMVNAGRLATGEAEMRPLPYPTKDRRAFWVEAWGDSMCGEIKTDDGSIIRIEPGDWLFVEPSRRPMNGKPALVEVQGGCTVKLWREHKDGVDLIPANPRHRVIQLQKDDVGELRAYRITFHDPKPRPI